ncbi:MAG: hypothetical protein ACR2KT_05665 [Methylocella sp.]
MSESAVPALISAASGLLGVIVGSGIPWLKETLSERKHARYLAIRVVCILDKFVEGCVDVVNDDGLREGQRDADGFLDPQVNLPDSPSFPTDVDWRSIKHDVMYRVLSLPRDVEIAKRSISHSSEFSDPPDFKEFFEDRQYQYACLGLTAAKLARDLRNTYSIPDRDFGHWNPVKNLRDKKDTIEQQRHARESQPSIFDEISAPNSEQDELKKL